MKAIVTLFAIALIVWLAGSIIHKPRAQDCEMGAFGCGHQEQHQHYEGWKDGTGNGCCSGQDCRPVRARLTFDGGWQIFGIR